MIRGETVILIEKSVVGKDPFGAVIHEETEVEVSDVLIGNPTTDSIANDLNLTGKTIAFVLGIPKGDDHNWKDTEVIIRGRRYRTYGYPLTQTEANVPGRWNTQVMVEAYE